MTNAGIGHPLSPKITPMSHGGFRHLVRVLAAIALSMGAVAGAHAASPPTAPFPPLLAANQQTLYAKAFEALDAGRVDEARRLAQQGSNKLAAKIFRWADLQRPHSGASFEDIAAFIDTNPSWPAQDILMRRAEEALVDRTDDSVVLAWFALRDPVTVDGAMRDIEALLRSGNKDKAISLIHSTWATGAFGAAQEKTFLSRYRSYLGTAEYARRLDNLLWSGRRDEAHRLLIHVDPDHRAVGEARLRLENMSGGVDYALRKVPARLENDPGLVFDRLRWRRRKGQEQAALDMLRQAPKDATHPDVWWSERAILARRAITAGRMTEAYNIANNHGMVNSGHAVDAEFLAGWVALRFLNEPEVALPHFTKLYEMAHFPVSRSRGAYWAGRAADAAGDKVAAQDWYTRAALFATTYYGQVAAAALDPASRPAFPETPAPLADERKAFESSELAHAARLLQQIGQTQKVKLFITRLVLNAKTPGEHTLAAELATRLDRPDLAVSAAKRSAQVASVMIPDYGWPMIALPRGDAPERALVFATVRQESAFETDAVSRAGARGLMQLMAPTARAIARKLALPTEHIETRLLSDPKLNVSLGRSYLAGLIDNYDGSYVLALAAYNAGPARVKQWVHDNGDPRQPNIDVIDWIELIPIDETRNYIHRVLENLQVYRQRLGGTQIAMGIDQDLRRRRLSENVP